MYREGKIKRTLKRELKELEVVEKESIQKKDWGGWSEKGEIQNNGLIKLSEGIEKRLSSIFNLLKTLIISERFKFDFFNLKIRMDFKSFDSTSI
jgi:hypothetical protein